ncbi:SCO6880 family protein [Catellatospora sp. NPDC049133]|uniref:SCO6880 family protein n=1 Tax=Catellatospora sp. NPDC049133 TaxID=3155499 RepID=UPI0034044696
MTTIQQPAAPQQRTYGNWRRGERPGLFGLGPVGTGLAFAVMVCATGTLVVSQWLALAIAVGGMVMLLPLAVRFHGRTGAQIIAGHVVWQLGRARRRHVYLTGMASPVSLSHRLPGILARSLLFEVETGLREPLGVVVIPQSRHYTVALRCQTEGMELVDQPVLDQRVGRMAAWLSACCREPMLEQAQITVETTPDQGAALAAEIAQTTVPNAPAAAKKVLADIIRTYPVGAAQVDTWVSLTFKPPTRGRWTHEAVCAEIATRLPSLIAGLHGAGASVVTPMAAADLALTVSSAYDPVTAARPGVRPAPGWDAAGPVAAQESWDRYRHDSGVSRTWGMVEAPRGSVYSSAFSRLTDPDPTLLRKRVAIIYRPYTPAAAAALVERDRRDALFTAGKKRQATARDTVDILAAEQAAHEEATGAGVTRFTVLVTATVADADILDEAEARLMARAGEARLTLRCMYRSQAAAFAATLPTGVVLPVHATIPF